MKEIWYVTYDTGAVPSASQAITGNGYSPDGTIPPGAIECMQAQYQNTSAYAVDSTTTPPTVVSAPAATLLKNAQAAQITKLKGSPSDPANTSYLSSINQPVSFSTAGGISKTYQADASSIANVQSMLNAYSAAGSLPSGFYWVAADNTQVAFTLADLEGLAKAIGDQGWTAFQKLQSLKTQVNSATSVSSVQAIVW